MDKEPKPDNDVAASSADTEFTAPDVKPDSMTRKYYEVWLLPVFWSEMHSMSNLKDFKDFLLVKMCFSNPDQDTTSLCF